MLGNIFILGDSYSTFNGYIPEGYATYYKKNGPYYVENKTIPKLDDNDVVCVTQTWWYNLTKDNGNLVRNCSWSGTTICNTGYNGCDNSKVSFIARFEKLLNDGFFDENKIDTLLLFGGTNDSWSDAPLGEPVLEGWTKEDLYNVLPAFSYLIDKVTKSLPHTKVYCMLNDELKEEITSFYKMVCEKYNVDYIELQNFGKRCGHPTVEGMESIKNQVLDYIEAL